MDKITSQHMGHSPSIDHTLSDMVYGDLKSILREPTLVLLLVAPIAILALLLGLPKLTTLVLDHYALDLNPYLDGIMLFLSLMPGMLYAMIYGFIILDELDEGIHTQIHVTPLGLQGYLRAKLQMPLLLSAATFLVALVGAARMDLPVVPLFGMTILVALEGMLGTLFLIAFSRDKVEGMVYGKVVGFFFMAVPVVLFWDTPWHWVTAMLPPFWVAKMFIHAQSGQAWVWVDMFIGTALHMAALIYLLKRFLTRGYLMS